MSLYIVKQIVLNIKASELNSLVKLNFIMTEEITMSSYHWLKNSPGTFQEFDTVCEKLIPNFYILRTL